MNIITAIINFVENPILELHSFYKSRNRANNMGESLEEYIKDLFAGTVSEIDENIRLQKISNTFSYTGNQNNPPDAILRNGDAIEIKKIEGDNSSIALNSSYPKHKLYSDSPMITEACRTCEEWDVKDIIYTIGIINNNSLSSIAMVYGEDYAADKDIYLRIKNTIRNGVNSIPNIEFAETNELGRINRVDPLGITYLRVRGMWGIDNPFNVFRYIFTRDRNVSFNLMCIINNDKYYSFENHTDLEELTIHHKDLNILDVQIKNPNNPSQLKNAKLITFTIQ